MNNEQQKCGSVVLDKWLTPHRNCGSAAPEYSPAIKSGFASPETIAHIASQKFMMASPLYRQEQEWKQNGIRLSRQTMSNWLIKACEDWLEPIYEEMKFRLCGHDVLHGDELCAALHNSSYVQIYVM